MHNIPSSQTAIIIGATGLTGSFLTSRLLQERQYANIRVLVRQPDLHPRQGLEIVIVDFENEPALAAAMKGADVVFCCIGTTIRKAGSQANFRKVDYDIPVRCARIAREQGIQQFLLMSSIGANANTRNFYLRTKGEAEQALLSTGIPAVHIFRPSVLLGPRKEFRLGETVGQLLIQVFYFLLQGSWRKYRAIKAATVAQAMINAAAKQETGPHIYESDAIQQLGLYTK
ncbi:oxidoreductase [Chitinophaga pendula]|uniref:oxidoreductase n=1 Tax=Chitinophaga TaxID=79328 RepID=UPI000BAEDC94|nr:MULTISPECIES: oxidoreductase [Chitinophaga]ASZ14384.1 hypothetical protein CK934_27280 [Chitinophaga sp. MD30]UCJ07964.1 oxidoreductase [Chitinophaga pendula]